MRDVDSWWWLCLQTPANTEAELECLCAALLAR